MFRWLAKKWAINDPLPKEADIIATISYAATRARLTHGSERTMLLAKEIAKLKTEATVVWGWFSKNPDRFLEREIKQSVLGGVCVGPVSSSTDECEAIRKVAETRRSGAIIVVTEGAHSRRCKRVWEYMFPNAEICFRSIPAWEAADPENPMWFQRRWQVWLLVNIAADLLAYRWEPILRFLIKRNFSQPAS